jgi:tetratricopeptide (TPR) repeat protein
MQFPHFGIPDKEALEYLNNTIPLLKSVQNARACVFVYILLGSTQACEGHYTASISAYQEGLKFAEETGEALNRAKALNFLGWVYSDLGWITEAKKLNEQSYKATLEIGSGAEEAEANAVVNLAENAVAEGNYEQAESSLKDLIEKAETDPGYKMSRHRWEVRLLCTLGEIYLHKNETDEVIKYARKAFEIAENTLNKRGMIRVNRLMGKAYLVKKDFSKAEKKLEKALAIAKDIGNPPHLWNTYFALGQLKEAQGFNQEAKKNYKEALNITEKTASALQDKILRDVFLNSDSAKGIRDSLSRL